MQMRRRKRWQPLAGHLNTSCWGAGQINPKNHRQRHAARTPGPSSAAAAAATCWFDELGSLPLVMPGGGTRDWNRQRSSDEDQSTCLAMASIPHPWKTGRDQGLNSLQMSPLAHE